MNWWKLYQVRNKNAVKAEWARLNDKLQGVNMAKIGKIQEVAVNKLVPYENNAKIHTVTQVEQIAESIKEFGFISPCLIDKDFNIIAGHGRIEAAKLLKIKTVPCIYVEGLTEEQRKAYIILDNKLTELGGWDYFILDKELEAIQEIDMSKFGFENFDDDEFDFNGLFEDTEPKEKPRKRFNARIAENGSRHENLSCFAAHDHKI